MPVEIGAGFGGGDLTTGLLPGDGLTEWVGFGVGLLPVFAAVVFFTSAGLRVAAPWLFVLVEGLPDELLLEVADFAPFPVACLFDFPGMGIRTKTVYQVMPGFCPAQESL
jgi:hypothetical protein